MKRAALALLLFHCAGAGAQTPAPLAEWQYSAGRVLEPYFVDRPARWQRMAGPVVEYLPRYEGAEDYRVQPGLILDARYKDKAFASTAEGFGWNFVREKGFRAGAALAYDLGRPEDRDPALHGLGDIDPSAQLKLFADVVPLFPVVVRLAARQALNGEGGAVADLSAYMPVVGSEKFFVMTGPSVSFATRKHLQTHFGITPAQAVASGYPAYETDAGLRDARFGFTATWMFGKRWLFDTTGAAQWLLGDARDSPLVQDATQYVVAMTFGYQW